ncbi:MAG: heme-binding protein [Woeseiaceae bacterium]|nr:heme-binding protein [Woeseiaceae bacterium]
MKLSASLLVTLGLLFWQSPAMSLEEPEYQVIETFEEFELRHYSPYLVAEIDVQGDPDDAGNSAFRILAGFIFGDNQDGMKMNMTAPVSSSAGITGKNMEMTAPVTSAQTSEGNTTFAFVMERKYSIDTLPTPNDVRIRIREVPERIMAVHRYSGRWTTSRYEAKLETLQAAVKAASIETVGGPILARYNSPFSLPILRRNEIMLEVSKSVSDSPNPDKQ